jgi:hypothetical protein
MLRFTLIKIWQNPIVTFQFPQNARKYFTTPIDLSPNSKQNSFGLINLENPSPCFQFVLNLGLYCCETSNRRIMMQVKNRLVLGWRNSIGQNQK